MRVSMMVLMVMALMTRGGHGTMAPMPAYGAMVKKMQKMSMGEPDPKVGEMVNTMMALESGGGSNADELGTYFEGDMLQPMRRSDVVPATKFQFRWSDGIVPYRFDGDFSESERPSHYFVSNVSVPCGGLRALHAPRRTKRFSVFREQKHGVLVGPGEDGGQTDSQPADARMHLHGWHPYPRNDACFGHIPRTKSKRSRQFRERPLGKHRHRKGAQFPATQVPGLRRSIRLRQCDALQPHRLHPKQTANHEPKGPRAESHKHRTA